jgi:acetyl esterase
MPEEALHPKSQELIDLLRSSGAPPMHLGTVEQGREMSDTIPQLLGPGPEVGSVSDIRIVGSDAEVSARVYRPEGDPLATIVYLHGGGWVVGSLDSFDPMMRMLCKESDCKVVSVDYRLAPEARFPAAADDAYAALVWVAEHEQEGPLIVGGDSAGGNLAAVAALRARDRGGPALAMQLLFYPVTDCDFETSSYTENADNELLGRKDMQWFWDHYVPEQSDRTSPDASPLRAEDLSGLPPAYVVTCGHDVLADEGRAYAARLSDAGVPVTHHHHGDQAHGFAMMINFLPPADEAVRAASGAIRESTGAVL